MVTRISYQGGFTIDPYMALVESGEFSITPRTVVHDILDGPPIHTLRPAGQTRGVLHLGFVTAWEANDALQAHKTAAVFKCDSSETAIMNFSYVVAGGDLRLTFDAETQRLWVLEVPYQEVSING